MFEPNTKLDNRVPLGDLEKKWEQHKFSSKLVNPANRKKHNIIVVGTGLAGAAAAASLGEMGYKVKAFCIQDSARRAHSIAAQGGVNAAKNYPNDGDSVYRLFYDTIKGGDFRAREANVYRLAEISNQIIDQCVAQGVPFAREYGGFLDNRSFGGAQVSRTFYARGQTGQQLLLGAYQALMRQVDAGNVQLFPRREMLDLVVRDQAARGIVTRNLVNGEVESHTGDAVILATGGYGNVFYLSTNAQNSNATAAWRCHRKGAFFANPCFTQIHPTCIPVHGEDQSKLTLMSESLRNSGRVWVPKDKDDKRSPNDIPEDNRDYYLERIYPSFGNLVPRDVASRQAKFRVDEGRSVVEGGAAVYLDFGQAIQAHGKAAIAEKYGNLFQMYEKITNESPYKVPMKIYPAIHYTMGGLWVDYNLESTIPGLFVAGEANFSDHGANRLGASALMQGLADGYFVLPTTVSDYLAKHDFSKKVDAREEVENIKTKTEELLKINGEKTPDEFHKALGKIMWEFVGMSRNKQGLEKAISKIKSLREEFRNNLNLTGEDSCKNSQLEKAGRVADFLELGELMAQDALSREESCGGHFREEHQTADNEAKRDDENFCHVSAYEFLNSQDWKLHKEELKFEEVKMATRSYV